MIAIVVMKYKSHRKSIKSIHLTTGESSVTKQSGDSTSSVIQSKSNENITKKSPSEVFPLGPVHSSLDGDEDQEVFTTNPAYCSTAFDNLVEATDTKLQNLPPRVFGTTDTHLSQCDCNDHELVTCDVEYAMPQPNQYRMTDNSSYNMVQTDQYHMTDNSSYMIQTNQYRMTDNSSYVIQNQYRMTDNSSYMLRTDPYHLTANISYMASSQI